MSERVAVLVGPNGRGSNMAKLVEASRAPGFPAVVDLVISPSVDSPALEVARGLSVETTVVPYGAEYGARLIGAVGARDWLCLAGFLRLVPVEVIQHLEGRVLNIHPSLLPKHGGKGMYGLRVHEAVLACGDKESGCTVHYVNERFDEGAVILQRRCEVSASDSAEELAARVLVLEHEAYPEALRMAITARGLV